jgi:hypothetical protein
MELTAQEQSQTTDLAAALTSHDQTGGFDPDQRRAYNTIIVALGSLKNGDSAGRLALKQLVDFAHNPTTAVISEPSLVLLRSRVLVVGNNVHGNILRVLLAGSKRAEQQWSEPNMGKISRIPVPTDGQVIVASEEKREVGVAISTSPHLEQ